MRGNYVFTFLTDNEKMNVREIADNWRVRDINASTSPQKLEKVYIWQLLRVRISLNLSYEG